MKVDKTNSVLCSLAETTVNTISLTSTLALQIVHLGINFYWRFSFQSSCLAVFITHALACQKVCLP